MSEDNSSPGWDAIDKALDALYPGVEPKHYGTIMPYRLGGPDPITGISVYKPESPVPHWHYVTYGFSELYNKESDNPEISGYGFEMTFRLKRSENEEQPPAWAINFLQNIARYVFQTGNAFEPGHTMNANGPICADSQTQLTAFCFAPDPDLSPIDTPNGRVKFLQLVGITANELDAAQQMKTEHLLDELNHATPKWVVDLDRHTILNDPDIAERIQGWIRDEAAATGLFYVHDLSFSVSGLLRKKLTIRAGAYYLENIRNALLARLSSGQPLMLDSAEVCVILKPEEPAGWTIDDKTLVLRIPPKRIDELKDIFIPKQGKYTIPGVDNATLIVNKTDIRDQQGGIIRTVG